LPQPRRHRLTADDHRAARDRAFQSRREVGDAALIRLHLSRYNRRFMVGEERGTPLAQALLAAARRAGPGAAGHDPSREALIPRKFAILASYHAENC
jgi:hypothetical protein